MTGKQPTQKQQQQIKGIYGAEMLKALLDYKKINSDIVEDIINENGKAIGPLAEIYRSPHLTDFLVGEKIIEKIEHIVNKHKMHDSDEWLDLEFELGLSRCHGCNRLYDEEVIVDAPKEVRDGYCWKCHQRASYKGGYDY